MMIPDAFVAMMKRVEKIKPNKDTKFNPNVFYTHHSALTPACELLCRYHFGSQIARNVCGETDF